MKTDNFEIKALVQEIVAKTTGFFGENCIAVYIMGSLARGGFSRIASDIDIGIIFTDLLPDAQERIDKIQSLSLKKYPSVSNTVSIFWGSIESINGAADDGRYPPFDRLDLIDHARLLAGNDIRDQLLRPSKKELEIASAEFSIDYLGNADRIEEFYNVSSIAEKGAVYVTKTILFPPRFIYLEKTGEIAGNDVSYKHYIDSFNGPDADLVARGYSWRLNALPDNLGVVEDELRKGLVPLYLRFIDLYIDKMESYGELELRDRLSTWKKNITNSCSGLANVRSLS